MASCARRWFTTTPPMRSTASRGHLPRRSLTSNVGGRTEVSPVSTVNSRLIYDALKAAGVRIMSALPETWLVHLIRMADDDPDMILVRLAKEEEGVGISAGAH